MLRYSTLFLLLVAYFLNVSCNDDNSPDTLNISKVERPTQEQAVSSHQLQGHLQQTLFNDPLHLAVANNQLNEVASLLQQISANQKTSGGYTPLHIAAQLNFQEIAQTLIAKGAKVNAKDNLGNTPLHYTAQQNSLHVASLLMQSGGDSSAQNNNNETPLDIAAKLGHADVLQTLL